MYIDPIIPLPVKCFFTMTFTVRRNEINVKRSMLEYQTVKKPMKMYTRISTAPNDGGVLEFHDFLYSSLRSFFFNVIRNRSKSCKIQPREGSYVIAQAWWPKFVVSDRVPALGTKLSKFGRQEFRNPFAGYAYSLCHIYLLLSYEPRVKFHGAYQLRNRGKVDVLRWRTENINVSALGGTWLGACHYLYAPCLSWNWQAEIAIVTEKGACNMWQSFIISRPYNRAASNRYYHN